MNADPPEQTLRRLGALVEERLGLRFHAGNADLLLRGVWRLGASDPAGASRLHTELARTVISQPAWQRLIAEVTVGETYFFRHPEDFTVLRRHVVPALLDCGHTQLRAWSAACASGEEAYSLAISLRSAAPATPIEVLGTDVNEAALAHAEKGCYGARSLRGARPGWESEWLPTAAGQRRVPSAVRSRVQFAVHNLVEPGPPTTLGQGGCQVIFCRNVLIYFGAREAAQVLARLAQSLTPGGYLFVSPLDLTHQIPELLPIERDGVWLFRKTAPRAVAPPRPVPAPPSALLKTEAQASPNALHQARRFADHGDLKTALQLARQAVGIQRTPEALHLLALILGEQNQPDQMRQLLEEAVAHSPSYIQGHLSLGLLPALRPLRRAYHLTLVLSLLATCPDNAVLAGPEPLSVILARRLAQQALLNLPPCAALPWTAGEVPTHPASGGDSR